MKLIVISNPSNLNNEHSNVCALFKVGLNYFHLRKPDFKKKELEEYIQQIPIEYRSRVVLHSCHQLALEYGLKGVHYTKQNPFNSENKQFDQLHQSISLHSIDQLKSAPANFQYAFLSPIFNSISKQDYNSTFDKSGFKTYLTESKKRIEIIALGGITQQTIPEAINYGFDGVAALGSIWLAVDPVEEFKKIFNVLNAINKKQDV